MQVRKTEKKIEYDTVNFSPLLHSDEFNGISLYFIHTNRAESSLLSETDMDWINSLYLKANVVLKLLIFCLLNYHILSLWISTKLKQEKKINSCFHEDIFQTSVSFFSVFNWYLNMREGESLQK